MADLALMYDIRCVTKTGTCICHKNLSHDLVFAASDAYLVNESQLLIATQALISETTLVSAASHLSWIDAVAEFSMIRTLRKIFAVDTTEDKNNLLFHHGIRVLSLFWIIFGHSLLYAANFTNNMVDVLSWTQNFAFTVVTSASLSVDTFFILSGFLTAILFITKVEKNRSHGKPVMNTRFFLLYYIHRYFRLTPTFMLVILVSVNLSSYFGRGPLFPIVQGFEPYGCRQYWWTTLKKKKSRIIYVIFY